MVLFSSLLFRAIFSRWCMGVSRAGRGYHQKLSLTSLVYCYLSWWWDSEPWHALFFFGYKHAKCFTGCLIGENIFLFSFLITKKKKRSYLHFVVLKICIRSSKYRKVKSKNKKSFHEQLNDSLLFLNFYPNFVKVLTLNFLIHDYIIILYVLKCNSLTLEETNPFTLDYNCY